MPKKNKLVTKPIIIVAIVIVAAIVLVVFVVPDLTGFLTLFSPSCSISATPINGKGYLDTTITVKGSNLPTGGGSFNINFGDNTANTNCRVNSNSGICLVAHTYFNSKFLYPTRAGGAVTETYSITAKMPIGRNWVSCSAKVTIDPPPCTDTDRCYGKDYQTDKKKCTGRVYDMKGILGQSLPGGYSYTPDNCISVGYGNPAKLQEGYCVLQNNNMQAMTETVECHLKFPNSFCDDGVCIKCKDSDVSQTYPDGKNFNNYGTVTTATQGTQMQSFMDSCDTTGKVLTEQYCYGGAQGTAKSVTYTCPGGCVGGACVAVSPLVQLSMTSAQVYGLDASTRQFDALSAVSQYDLKITRAPRFYEITPYLIISDPIAKEINATTAADCESASYTQSSATKFAVSSQSYCVRTRENKWMAIGSNIWQSMTATSGEVGATSGNDIKYRYFG